MKIRNGFVSNSSSSSFILVGVKLSDITEDQRELLENNSCFSDVDNCEDPMAIGEEWTASDYEINSISLSDLNKSATDLKNLLGGNINVSVFFGERYG